jgi:hypothetical protein
MADVLMAQAAAGAVPWGSAGAGAGAGEAAALFKSLGPAAVFLLPLMLGGDSRQPGENERPNRAATLEGGNIAGYFNGLQTVAKDSNGAFARLGNFVFNNSRPGWNEAEVARTRAATEDALAKGRDGEAATLIGGTLKETTRRGYNRNSEAESDRVAQSAVQAWRAAHPLPSAPANQPSANTAGSRPPADVASGQQAANRPQSSTAAAASTPALNTRAPAVNAPPQVTQANVNAVSEQVQKQLVRQEAPVLRNYVQRIDADAASLRQLVKKGGDQPVLRERYQGVDQAYKQFAGRVDRYNNLAGAEAAAAAYPSVRSFNDPKTGLKFDAGALPAQRGQVQQQITAAQANLDQRLGSLERGIQGQQQKVAAQTVTASKSAMSQKLQGMDQRIAAADQRLATADAAHPAAKKSLSTMRDARGAYQQAGGDSLRAQYGQALVSSGHAGRIHDDKGRAVDRTSLNKSQQTAQQSMTTADQRFSQAAKRFDQAMASANPGQPQLPPAKPPAGQLPPGSAVPGRPLVTPPPADWGAARVLITPPPNEPPGGGNNKPPEGGGGRRFSFDPDTNKKIAEVLGQAGLNVAGAGVATAYANWPNQRTSAPITDPQRELAAYTRDPKGYAAANYNNVGGVALPVTIDGTLLWDGKQKNLMMRIPPDLYDAARQQAKAGGWTSPGQGTPYWIEPKNNRLMTAAALGNKAVEVQLRPPASSEGALNYAASSSGARTPTSGIPGLAQGWSGSAQVTIGQQDGVQWSGTALADFSGAITPQRREVLGILDAKGNAAAVGRVYQNGNIGTVGLIGSLHNGGPDVANVSNPKAPNQRAVQTLAVQQVVHRVTYAQVTAGLSQVRSPADRDWSVGAAGKYAVVSETDMVLRARQTNRDGSVQLGDVVDEWDARNVTVGKVGVGTSGGTLAKNLPSLLNPQGNLPGLNPFSGSVFTADSDGQSYVVQGRWQAPEADPAKNPTQVPAQFRIDPNADGGARLMPRGMTTDVPAPGKVRGG